MKRIFTLSVLMVIAISAGAYQWLRVGDPAGDWGNWVNGTIEEVNYHIQPQGLYLAVDMHVVFSTSNKMPDTQSDSLEIQYGFTLPPNSSVIDASLLVEDKWQNAWILDRRQARSIYEGIVNRRQDPMILYKNYGDNYYLQIFPMERSGKREMKLSFIVPGNFEGDRMYVRLPLNEYANFTRFGKVGAITVNIESPSQPILGEDPTKVPAKVATDGSTTSTWQFTFDSGTDLAATLLTAAPGEEAVLFSQCNTEGEGYYELAFNPAKLLGLENNHKYLFVLDHDPNATFTWYVNGEREYISVKQDEVIESIRTFALENLNEDDLFNIQYASGDLMYVSAGYEKASEANVNKACDLLKSETFTSHGLAEQLVASMQMVQKDGGDLMLITNNSENRYIADSARAVLRNVMASVDSLSPVNLVDYNYIYYYNYYWGEDISFYASSQVLSEIARITEGDYVSVHNTRSIAKALVELKKQTEGDIQFFKAELKPAGGFTMGDYFLTNSSTTNYWYRTNISEEQTFMNDNVRMIGKYMGNAPFTLSLRGFFKGELIQFEKVLDDYLTNADCDFMAKAWTSKYIADKESGWLNVNQMNEVVNLSIKNRILSNQTAFLALEPGMDSLLANCIDCGEPQNGSSSSYYGNEGVKVTDDLAGSWGGSAEVSDEGYSRGYLEGAKASCDSVYVIAYGSGYKEGVSDAADAIDEVSGIEIFSATPNPFVNSVNLIFDMGDSNDRFIRSVEIIDVLGRSLRVFDAVGEPNRFVISWDGNDQENNEVPSGNYFVILTTEKTRHAFRIVKE